MYIFVLCSLVAEFLFNPVWKYAQYQSWIYTHVIKLVSVKFVYLKCEDDPTRIIIILYSVSLCIIYYVYLFSTTEYFGELQFLIFFILSHNLLQRINTI